MKRITLSLCILFLNMSCKTSERSETASSNNQKQKTENCQSGDECLKDSCRIIFSNINKYTQTCQKIKENLTVIEESCAFSPSNQMTDADIKAKTLENLRLLDDEMRSIKRNLLKESCLPSDEAEEKIYRQAILGDSLQVSLNYTTYLQMTLK